METGKLMPEVDAFSVDAAAGAEQVEVTRVLVGSILKPKVEAEKTGKETHLSPCQQEQMQEAPPKTRMEVVGTGLAPKVEILGRGAMAGGWTIGITGGATVGCTTGVAGIWVAEEFPNELRNSVRLSFGSGGRGGMILMQVLGRAA